MTNFTSNLLNLKDENITFEDNILEIKKKNILYKVIQGSLTYNPEVCPICGCVNINHSIIKNGSKTSDIKLLSCNGNPTILRLKKQRFFCKECNHTFSAKTNIVAKNCHISRIVKLHVLDNVKLKISEKDIARMNFVSHSTVSKAIDRSFRNYIPDPNFLPEHLMFDEFKSTKYADGSMSFIFANSVTHEIVDIVENRQLPNLKRYFSSYSKKARDNVKTICIDMYRPYISLIKDLFPNANIIIDKFHIVQLLSRALNKTRIESLKAFKTNSAEYKRLKKYWKLILKDAKDLNCIDFKKQKYFSDWVSEKTIVERCVYSQKTLDNTYESYQTLLTVIQNGDSALLNNLLLNLKDTDISPYMQIAIKTLLKYDKYIKNTLYYKYSNGPLEGINNYIKVYKRIAFGYKSHFHFRNRILISRGIMKPMQENMAA